MTPDPASEAWRETVRQGETARSAASLEPGQAVGRFQLEALLGRGGMGEVWKARDPQLGRAVAIKFLLGQDLEGEKRFLLEAQVVAGLGHPNIAAVHEVGVHANRSYIVMQFVEGTTLDRAKLAPEAAVKAIRDAAVALAFAHQRGVIHRDIKPTNLMVARDQVFVMDFGLAKQTEARSTVSLSGSVIGTPAYMSPEQARGETKSLDARTDVYSLGATLYELLTGRPPFAVQELFALLEDVVLEEPDRPSRLNPRIPSEVETIVLKAMEKERDRRYPSAAALAEDLNRYLSGEPIQARASGVLYKLKKRIRRNPVAWIAGAAALLLAIAGLAVYAGGKIDQAASIVTEGALREAAELSRRATNLAKDAKALLRIKTSTPKEWEALYDQSLGLARAAIEKAPSIGGPYYTLGQVLEARHQWAEAIEEYTRALDRDPALAEAWYHRCLCRLELFQDALMWQPRIDRYVLDRPVNEQARARAEAFKKGALEDLERYRALKGPAAASSREERYVRASMLLTSGGLKTAESIAEELLKETRTDELVWFLKARTQAAQRRLPEAIQTIDLLISDVMPQFGRAFHARGLYKLRLDPIDALGARDDFSAAVRLEPASWRGYLGRSRARLELGEWEEAIQDIDRGSRGREPEASVFFGRGEAKEGMGDLDGAMADFNEALKLEKDSLTAIYARGRVRLAKGDRAGAVGDFTKSAESLYRAEKKELPAVLEHWSRRISNDPRDAWAYFQRAMQLRDKGDIAAALLDLAEALEYNPDFAPAWRHRGLLRESQGDPVGVMADFDKALEVDPRYAEAYVDRAWRRRVRGDVAGSIDDCNRAIAINARLSEAWHNRGVARRVKGDPAGALKDFDAALEIDPDSVWANLERGITREELASKEPARAAELLRGAAKDLEKGLSIAPSSWPYRTSYEEALKRVLQKK